MQTVSAQVRELKQSYALRTRRHTTRTGADSLWEKKKHVPPPQLPMLSQGRRTKIIRPEKVLASAFPPPQGGDGEGEERPQGLSGGVGGRLGAEPATTDKRPSALSCDTVWCRRLEPRKMCKKENSRNLSESAIKCVLIVQKCNLETARSSLFLSFLGSFILHQSTFRYKQSV